MSGDQFHVPLVIRMTTGAGRQLAAQHSHSLEGWYAHIPGLRVLAPATLEDARGMLWTALEDPDPVLIFEHGASAMRGELADDAGPGRHRARRRAPSGRRRLAHHLRRLAVQDPRSGRAARGGRGRAPRSSTCARCARWTPPTLLASVARTHRAVIVDEGWRSGGISAEISARITEQAFYDLERRSRGCAAPRCPSRTPKHLEDAALPQVDDDVAAAARSRGRMRVLMGEFRMPSLGADMDAGTLLEWRVAPGDKVHRGDIVAVVDTEKADIEVEVFEDGVVDELLVAGGHRGAGRHAAGLASRPAPRR